VTSAAVHLVQLSDAELAALRQLPDLLRRLGKQANAGGKLTLVAAARRIKRRTADVQAAIVAKKLPARRQGRRWSIDVRDLDEWARR
jgi:hypothetical protein